MRTHSSNDVESDREGASLALSVPIRDGSLFKHSASAPVLNFLADNPEFDLSVRQLSRVTEVSDRATGDAVDVLAANGLVEVSHEGNARRVRINRSVLDDPRDPIRRIPQVEFQTPVWVATNYLFEEFGESIAGIVLFGSVVRGEADQQSDIDLWILVESDLLERRNSAHRLARTLESTPIPPTIALDEASDTSVVNRWAAVRNRLEADDSEWLSAQRYSFEFLVETPASVRQQSNRVDSQQLFGEGITIISSGELDRLKQELLEE